MSRSQPPRAPRREEDDAALEAEGEPRAASEIEAAVRAAGAPAALPEDVHERLLSAALGGSAPPLALPPGELVDVSAGEERRAAALRDRLAGGLRPDPEAEPDDPVEELVALGAALRHAAAPRSPSELEIQRALQRAGLGRRHAGALRSRLTFAAAFAVAAAAAVALIPRATTSPGPAAALVPARSTQELFDPAEPFPREGGTSERIDRIAAARRGDLRENRFARWGIR